MPITKSLAWILYGLAAWGLALLAVGVRTVSGRSWPRSVGRRTPIREVVPEVLVRNGSPAWTDVVDEEAEQQEEFSDGTAEALEEEAFTEGTAAPEETASVDAAELEAARAAAAAAEAARAEAREQAARAEALLAEALREAEAREAEARAAAAELEAARAEAAQLEQALLEAARTGAARAEAERQQAEHAERTVAVPEGARADTTPVASARAQAAQIDTEAATDVETEVQDRQAAQPAPVETQLTCEISFWRGYRKSAFFARTHVDGETVAVAESPLFRARGNGLPDESGEALAAYEALREKLERQGWEPSGSRGTWFGQVFRRDLTVSAEPAPE
jgi:hypothetical protein